MNRSGRTQKCGVAEARAKLQRAERFVEVAALIVDEPSPDPDFCSAAAALTVLAGIAASDAACCKALGRRSRSDSHHDAEALLAQITPGGGDAANALRRLIDEKDEAHYGFYNVSAADLRSLLRQAKKLIGFAHDVLARGA
ncbi:MAG TPA: hypothetical protein VHC01_08190 [Gaiellaceae bacterium]|nr:hypothetical protein [Gaiellaceae bacterium]